MFRRFAWVVMALGIALSQGRGFAAGADDLFIAIYNLIQQADAKVDGGAPSEASRVLRRRPTVVRSTPSAREAPWSVPVRATAVKT